MPSKLPSKKSRKKRPYETENLSYPAISRLHLKTMKTKIELDLKSLALGAVIAALAIFGTAASNGPSTVTRFQVSVGGDGKAVILDTTTGQCWTSAINANGQSVSPIGTNTFLTPKNT